jgi:hypothetical protein
MTDKHWDALVGPARDALEDLLWAGDDMADRIEELEAENTTLRSMVEGVIADTGDDPEIMAASRAEWAARAFAAEAKLAKAILALDEAIYLLDPDEEDIAKETGLHRIVTIRAELKGEK